MRRPTTVALGTLAGVVAGMSAWTFRWSYLRWGATGHEATESLPGDDLLPTAGLVATRAITVGVPPERVWPWVAQLGQGRGGFYSYDGLENLLGCRVESADRVHPEWQDVAVGDVLRLHPKVALRVADVAPGRHLVVDGRASVLAGPDAAGVPYDFTWSFVVRRQPHRATRLLVRERYGFTHAWSPLVVEPLAAGSALMTRRMLLGIRERAEAAGQGVAGQGVEARRDVEAR